MTEVKLAEIKRSEADERSEADLRRLAAVVEDSNDAVTVQDLGGRILAWNRGAERMYGYSKDEALQMNIAVLVPDDQRAQAHDSLRAAARGEKVASLEVSRLTKDGRTLDVSLTMTVLVDEQGRAVGIATTERDISEYKRALQALRDSEERFRAFVTASSDVVYRMSPDWSEMRELRGREFIADTAAPSGSWLEKYIHPDDQPHVMAVINEAIRAKSVFQLEHRVLRVDGTLGWTFSRAIPLLDASGAIVEWFGAASDITARKQAEEALRESEERFRVLVLGVKDCAIYMLAPDGTVKSWSAAAEQMFGFREEEIVGQHRAIFFTDEDRRAGMPQRDLDEAEAHGLCEHEAWRVRKDGALFWADVLITALRDDAGNLRGFAAVHRDFTEHKWAEAALREGDARYRALFDHMSEGLAYCRMLYDGDRPVDFIYLKVNPAFETLTGLKDVVGKKVSEVVPGILESDPGLIERYARVARGYPERFETYIESMHNWFAVSAYSPARGDFVTAFHVITERKRAEEELRASEERLRMAQQAARVGSFDWDIQTGVNTWTPELEALYGLPPGGFAETEAAWESLVHPDDRAEAVRRVEQAFETGGLAEWEWRVVWPDGSVHWLAGRWRVFKDRSGKPLRMTGINIDITERKRAEELRASEAALREADRQKNQFLATLSHELRNPLAPIRNSLYILERAATGGEQARRAQAILHRQIGQLTWLIDDLLDVTRITHGKVQLQRERLDLNELAHRAVEDHRTVFAKSAVRLEVLPAPAEVWIDGDRVRLAQIIGNLLQNAAKFTPRGGKATVSLQTDAARGLAFLTVRDTGSGIEPEMLPRLFQAFTQADATLDRSKGGLGLGLALVKGLVELHGGSVRVASDGLDKGAAFTISLPLDVTVARAMSAQRGLAGTAAPRRVLVIEDNEDAADTLREVLELDEHVVEVAYSGRDGIEKARAFHPDVVLCDIGLPEMDGYQVARTMRADPELGHVGLVAVSGYAQPEDVATAKEAGFEVHLAKPPSIEALERAIAAVGRSRSR